MNREMRRMAERQERRQKKQEAKSGTSSRAAAANRAAGATRTREQGERQSLIERITRFLHDVRVEMRKVSWPTREQMTSFTIVTLVTTIALTLLTFGLDAALKELVFLAIGQSGG